MVFSWPVIVLGFGVYILKHNREKIDKLLERINGVKVGPAEVSMTNPNDAQKQLADIAIAAIPEGQLKDALALAQKQADVIQKQSELLNRARAAYSEVMPPPTSMGFDYETTPMWRNDKKIIRELIKQIIGDVIAAAPARMASDIAYLDREREDIVSRAVASYVRSSQYYIDLRERNNTSYTYNVHRLSQAAHSVVDEILVDIHLTSHAPLLHKQ